MKSIILTTLSMISLVFAGAASANPYTSALVNTTCSYSQVVAALNAEFPDAAAGFNSSPIAQTMLQGFLNSSKAQRQATADELAANPKAQEYFGIANQVAASCNNY